MQKKVELFQDTGRDSLNGKEFEEAKLEIESFGISAKFQRNPWQKV